MYTSFKQLSVLFLLRVETIDGTAEAGSDYKPLKEEITFAINERLREIYIEIIDDDEWEPDEIFFVKLSMPIEHKDAVVGKMAINQITIINDDGKKREPRLSDRTRSKKILFSIVKKEIFNSYNVTEKSL